MYICCLTLSFVTFGLSTKVEVYSLIICCVHVPFQLPVIPAKQADMFCLQKDKLWILLIHVLDDDDDDGQNDIKT